MSDGIKVLAMTAVIGVMGLVVTGCATDRAAGGAAESSPRRAALASPRKGAVVWNIKETMNGGGYTYMYLEKDGKRMWAAVPETAAEVGDVVELNRTIGMTNFTSRSLNRTFQKIMFADGLTVMK